MARRLVFTDRTPRGNTLSALRDWTLASRIRFPAAHAAGYSSIGPTGLALACRYRGSFQRGRVSRPYVSLRQAPPGAIELSPVARARVFTHIFAHGITPG